MAQFVMLANPYGIAGLSCFDNADWPAVLTCRELEILKIVPVRERSRASYEQQVLIITGDGGELRNALRETPL